MNGSGDKYMGDNYQQLHEDYVRAQAGADALRHAWAALLPSAPPHGNDWKPLPRPNAGTVFDALVASEELERRAQAELFRFLRNSDVIDASPVPATDLTG